jgi:phosphodiesterase/alkaline phosphatase D-like protein
MRPFATRPTHLVHGRTIAAILIAVLWFSVLGPSVAPTVRAADGSGTAVVTPTSVNAGSVGNALTFTYTAAETMDSGSVRFNAPSGWSAPQGTPGVAGYVTASTAGGIIADVEDTLDSTANWVAQAGNCNLGLSADTVLFREGTASLSCRNSAATNNTSVYRNLAAAENWSGYTNIAFWIRTSATLNTGHLKFLFDDNASLATPITSINLPAVTANVWTYVNLPLTGTRTSVLSLGFQTAGATAVTNNFNIDDILLGPGLPSFPGGGDIRVRLLQLAAGQTVTVVYGAGGGAGGAAAPASGQTSVFNTTTRISNSGVLTTIASSPIVTVFNPTPTTTSITPTTATAGSPGFTMTVNGTNFVPTSVVRFNGSDRVTTYVSPTQLTAAILADGIAAAGSNSVTVFNPTPGGGTSNAQTFTVMADVAAPSSVTNLALSSPTTSSMVLTWTAPGDDGAVGTASLYDIRYSTAPIVTAGDFTSAALVSGEPVPSVAGTVQNMTVTGLSANTAYYFAMKTQDELPNVSAVSNVPTLTTVAAPDSVTPAVVTNLALSSPTTSTILLTWTAPGDDGAVGTANLYDIRYSSAPIVTPADFTAAADVLGEPVPAVAGTVQNVTATGLSANTTYYFAMKTRDEVPNISAVSNVPSLATASNPDVTAPTAITDLVLSGPTTSSITLFWTAPGDDGTVGIASLYDIRYSTAPITTAADFSTASLVSGEPIPPSTAGTVQNMTVTGLSANTTYYFAMKVQDEVPNVSTVSNVPSLATAANPDVTAPSSVTNLALSSPTTSSMVLTWTAPGDDGAVGTANLYDIRYSTAPIVTPADFTAASQVSGEPIPTVAGTAQNMTVTGLSANTTYYFAMKTQDEAPNVSVVSNVPTLATVSAPDSIAPSAITTLSVPAATTDSIVVVWTAPGDDGNVGTAALFDLRYATSPIVTLADFSAAAQASGEPPPSVAGSSHFLQVFGLSANTTYFFAIKTQDEVPNISAVSNAASRSTSAAPDTVAPSAVTDLSLSAAGSVSMTLSWTAPGDDGTSGTAAAYDIRYSTSAIVTPADFSAATQVSGEPAPSVGGSAQSMVVGGLAPSTSYFFVLKSQDEAPNISAVSNAPSIPTIGAGGVPNVVQTSVGLISPDGGETLTDGAVADVRWTLNGNVAVRLRLLLSTDGGATFPRLILDRPDLTGGYQWTVNSTPTTSARIRIEAVDAIGSTVSSDMSNGNFTILAAPAGPTPAVPAVSGIVAASITQHSAIITWKTDKLGDSLVRFGPTAALGSTSYDVFMTLDHTVPVVGLAAGTTYQYKVCSKAPGGVEGCSGVAGFTTLPADAPVPTYAAAEALVGSPTINADKMLVSPPPGVVPACVSGTLMKQPNDGDPATQADSAVYYCGADGKRYVFPDLGTYRSWYPDFSAVSVVTATELAAVPLGGNVTYRPGRHMIKIQTDPKVYAIDKGGVLRWVTTEALAQSLYGLLWSGLVRDVSDAFFINYVVGAPITSAEVAPAVPAVIDETPTCSAAVTFTEFLSLGSGDAEVLALQKLLQCLGYFPADIVPNGYFGPATQNAVKGFQTANGIDPAGHVGPATREALNRYVVR